MHSDGLEERGMNGEFETIHTVIMVMRMAFPSEEQKPRKASRFNIYLSESLQTASFMNDDRQGYDLWRFCLKLPQRLHRPLLLRGGGGRHIQPLAKIRDAEMDQADRRGGAI